MWILKNGIRASLAAIHLIQSVSFTMNCCQQLRVLPECRWR